MDTHRDCLSSVTVGRYGEGVLKRTSNPQFLMGGKRRIREQSVPTAPSIYPYQGRPPGCAAPRSQPCVPILLFYY